MGTWDDIKQGKKPWKPKLSVRSVSGRLAFCLPFLAFGLFLQYRTADCHVTLIRESPADVRGEVHRSIFGLATGRKNISQVIAAYYDSEMRLVEKGSIGSTSTSATHTDTRSVSRTVLAGGESRDTEIAVSEFRFDSDQANNELSQKLTAFLSNKEEERIDGVIQYGGDSNPVALASVFLFGLGGFIFISLVIDFLLLGLQHRVKKSKRRA